MAEGALGSNDSALLRKPEVLGMAFHALGMNHLHLQNLKTAGIVGQTIHLFQMAFASGLRDAAIDAAQLELASNETQATWDTSAARRRPLAPQISAYIKEKALKGADPRAMMIYLRDVLRGAQTKAVAKQNYQLAKQLFDMVEPSQQLYKRVHFSQRYGQPWQMLYDAADHYLSHIQDDPVSDKVQEDLDNALRVGAVEYKDPRAAALVLGQKDVIEKHSKQWVELATQSAIAGYADSCFSLALYHLRKDRWLPVDPGKNPKNWVGIEWLAVSAAASDDNAQIMLRRYLGLAHLLREYGHSDEGFSWIQAAQENIMEAGLDPNGEWNAYVDTFLQTWNDDNVPQKSSEEFLGPVE